MRMRKFAMCLGLVFVVASAMAQSPAMKPFEVNMDRVKVSAFGGNFAQTKSYLIPTYTIQVSSLGSVWASAGRTKQHAKYYVYGLKKDLMQELSKKLQDDLVTKMRAAGYTVLTYEDVKGEPDVSSHGLLKIDDRYGLPTGGGFGAPVTFVIANPTDAQAFDAPIQGPGWWLRGIAKEKALTVVVPELTFTTPQMFGQSSSTAYVDSAGISTDPRMIFEGAKIYGMNPKGGGPMINVQRHGQRTAAEVAGKIKKVSEDSTVVSGVFATGSDDYVMQLDETAFSDGVLRVGFGVNDMIVAEIRKEK
jgi:hypothetical protein